VAIIREHARDPFVRPGLCLGQADRKYQMARTIVSWRDFAHVWRAERRFLVRFRPSEE
jgi:hypothetical protein